jgi:hypothetical protein
MSKMIQIRNVPERMHRELMRRARARGLTLTAYIEQILERELSRPPAAEVFERIDRRKPVNLKVTAADLIRAERASRPS